MARPKKTMLPPKPGKENLLIPMGAKTVNQALAGMKGGESRTGFLGEGNIIHRPDFIHTEALDDAQKAQKKAFQSILSSIIIPNPLSGRSTSEQDRRSLILKLSKCLLNELKMLLPSRLQEMSAEELQGTQITEEEKAEIQTLYLDISP